MIEYSRPSLKDRTAFAAAGEKSIEKYGNAWRTGAKRATKITFPEDIKINGKTLTILLAGLAMQRKQLL